MDPIDTAVAAISAQLTGALYTLFNGAKGVADLQPLVQQALTTTDLANVLTGYAAAVAAAQQLTTYAGAVQEAVSASTAIPPSPTVTDYVTALDNQNPTIRAALA